MRLVDAGRRVRTATTDSPATPVPSSKLIAAEDRPPMIAIAGGAFEMGDGQGDSGPIHGVRVDGFVMDQFEVTQEQLARLQIPDASHFKDPLRPVEMIRWSEAAMFCNERSRSEGLQPCYDEATFACDFDADGYRLPTEAEWEYAARAGGALQWEDAGGRQGAKRRLPQLACYGGREGATTRRVGSLQPNPLGLHDLLGNVAEWCHDRYAEDYYAVSPAENPRGPDQGEKRVLRGGAWNSPAAEVHPARCAADEPGIDDACFARDNYGFRCVRKLTEEEAAMLAGIDQ